MSFAVVYWIHVFVRDKYRVNIVDSLNTHSGFNYYGVVLDLAANNALTSDFLSSSTSGYVPPNNKNNTTLRVYPDDVAGSTVFSVMFNMQLPDKSLTACTLSTPVEAVTCTDCTMPAGNSHVYASTTASQIL